MAKRGRPEGSIGPTSVVTPLPLSGAAPGSLILLDGEVVRHEESNTQLVLNSTTVGSGKLFVTTYRLAWVPDVAGSQGYAIEYPNIVLHAVCRDLDAYSKPCIFCQLNADEGSDNDDATASVGGASTISDLRLIPASAAALDSVFEAMSACQALHPDIDDDEDDAAMMGQGLGLSGPG